MKKTFFAGLSVLGILTAFLLAFSVLRQGQEALAGRIAPEILRFHVLADSGSPQDQQLKLEVRDQILAYAASSLEAGAGKEETLAWLKEHQSHILQLSQNYVKSRGFDDPVSMEFTREYFPTKAYGDLVFPCGVYDAVRITIGRGTGPNWWCVLYPPLCYTDALNAVVPQESKNTLQALIPQDDYQALLHSPEYESRPKIQIRSRILDLILGKS